MMQTDSNNKQKTVIILLVVIGMVCLVILSIFQSLRQDYGKEISIDGYNTYLKDMPKDRRHILNSSLYKIVELNSAENAEKGVKDATIRKDSALPGYDTKTSVHSGTFIVDMASIKQSYSMYYEWSTDANAEFSGYTALATCLSEDKLIYGEFNCTDSSIQADNRLDPIIEYLPYHEGKIRIAGGYDDNEDYYLNAFINLDTSDIRNGKQESIDVYKVMVVDWVKSVGLDPADYSINYVISD